MAGEIPITLIGNLTADPEIRFTPSGHAVAKFTLASTPRFYNKTTGNYEDGETVFMACNVWREAAENAVSSLNKGTRAVVHGRMKARSYETKDGSKRTVFEIEVDAFGPDLTRATAVVTKNPAKNGNTPSAPDTPPATAGTGSSSWDEMPF